MSKAQELIKKEGLVGMIITDPYNMRHISGFRGGEGALYISATQQVLITDSRYTEQAEKESDFTIVQEHRGHTREQIFVECLEKEEGTLAIGYEDQSLLCNQFDKMKKALPVKEWVPMGEKWMHFAESKLQKKSNIWHRQSISVMLHFPGSWIF